MKLKWLINNTMLTLLIISNAYCITYINDLTKNDITSIEVVKKHTKIVESLSENQKQLSDLCYKMSKQQTDLVKLYVGSVRNEKKIKHLIVDYMAASRL